MPIKKKVEKTYQDGHFEGFAMGVEEGRRKRGLETVEEDIQKYWRWGEWVTYIVPTFISIGASVLMFWGVGVFIRWEVGPIPQLSTGGSGGAYYSTTPCTCLGSIAAIENGNSCFCH